MTAQSVISRCSGAFGGDPRVRLGLLSRVEAIGADDSWTDLASMTGWNAEQFEADGGFPASLVAFLEILCADLGTTAAKTFLTRAVSAMAPGVALGDAPVRLLCFILDRDDVRAWHPEIAERLSTIQRLSCTEGRLDRRDWTAIRRDVVQTADRADTQQRRAISRLWEEACWPVLKERSVLSATYRRWTRIHVWSSEWSEEMEAHCQALLEKIWNDCEDLRNAGATVNYNDIFLKSYPNLHLGFVKNLADLNAQSRDKASVISEFVIAAMSTLSRD